MVLGLGVPAALIKMDGLAPEQTTSPRPPRRWGIERADQVPSSLESFTSNLGPASVGTVYPIYVHFRRLTVFRFLVILGASLGGTGHTVSHLPIHYLTYCRIRGGVSVGYVDDMTLYVRELWDYVPVLQSSLGAKSTTTVTKAPPRSSP